MTSLSPSLPIAVLDSGLGGISVLRHLLTLMPSESYLYFGDTKNAPYGTKSKSEVLSLTRHNLSLLQEQGIKALVIACNTATGAAAKALREENPSLPIIGIEPALKPASLLSDHPQILVMATPLTLKTEKFHALAARFSEDCRFFPLPCPGLVELIEEGELNTPALHSYLSALFAPYKDKQIDGIVLGCTHYPHIKAAIASHFPPETVILDGGDGTARQTMRRLRELDLLSTADTAGSVTFFGNSNEKFREIAIRLLNQ